MKISVRAIPYSPSIAKYCQIIFTIAIHSNSGNFNFENCLANMQNSLISWGPLKINFVVFWKLFANMQNILISWGPLKINFVVFSWLIFSFVVLNLSVANHYWFETTAGLRLWGGRYSLALSRSSYAALGKGRHKKKIEKVLNYGWVGVKSPKLVKMWKYALFSTKTSRNAMKHVILSLKWKDM